MKLVDILARDLPIWPNGVRLITQQASGYLFDEANYPLDILVQEVAEDNFSAVLSKTQWQAAVDALKVESAPAWAGIGLPPVGTVCEYLENGNGDWQEVTIVAIDHRLDYQFAVFHGDKGYSGDRRAELFRPIRTPEQIAYAEKVWNDERAKIKGTLEIYDFLFGHGGASRNDLARALYNAGYRKTKVEDN